jgi:hypothetical protein
MQKKSQPSEAEATKKTTPQESSEQMRHSQSKLKWWVGEWKLQLINTKKEGGENLKAPKLASSLSMSPLTSLLGQLMFGLHKEHVVRRQQQQQQQQH